jgi:iron complex outermembrane receptor protein
VVDDLIDLNKTFYGFNFSAGAVYNKKPYTFRINASSGIRPPHISELLSDGPHHGSLRYEIGDRNLKKEQAYQLDASLRLSFEHIDLVINPFYNHIQNYIFLNNSDSVINGFQVYEYDQVKMAHLFGGEFGLHYHPHFAHWLHWETSFSYVHSLDGENRGFPFSPPADITNTLKFEFKFKKIVEKLTFLMKYTYYFQQHNIAEFESASSDIHMLDVGMNMSFKTKNPFEIRLGIQNALNYDYVGHLSTIRDLGIPNAGYNVYISAVWELKIDKH